ncbi:A24 family peptidase [Parvibaculum sp.]|uniref:A24 family peptidase n=1 Tax=Parvibaculum sp. TaxID=2024848 RepID=UPI003BABAB7C
MSMLFLAVFPLAMIFGGLWDLTTMTIPNLLTVAFALAFAVLVPFLGLTWQEVGLHVAAGVLMLLVGMGLFALGWIGGGDAKFIAATALWIGMSDLLAYLILASIFGGVLTLLILVFRSMPLPLFMMRQDWIARLHDRKEGIPYGVALAIGGLMVFPQTVWFAAAAHAA